MYILYILWDKNNLNGIIYWTYMFCEDSMNSQAGSKLLKTNLRHKDQSGILAQRMQCEKPF